MTFLPWMPRPVVAALPLPLRGWSAGVVGWPCKPMRRRWAAAAAAAAHLLAADIHGHGGPPLLAPARPAPTTPAAVRHGTLRVLHSYGRRSRNAFNEWRHVWVMCLPITPCRRPPPSHAIGWRKRWDSERDQGHPLIHLQPAPYWPPVTMASGPRCAQMHSEANGKPSRRAS